jgi:hypothetical protein
MYDSKFLSSFFTITFIYILIYESGKGNVKNETGLLNGEKIYAIINRLCERTDR